MTSLITGVKASVLNKALKVVNQSFTPLTENNQDQVILELQTACRELIKAITEQQGKQFGARELDVDGLPLDGARCELLDGQYLRLQQAGGGGSIVTVPHQLGRRPQGALFVQSGASNNLALINGSVSSNISPADEETISFVLNGVAGNLHICVIY